MMTNDMIWAELALRGWRLSSSYIVKQLDAERHAYIVPGQARVILFMAKWPLPDDQADVPPNDEQLRNMHDIISKYERGDYEPRQDGSTPNVARVDSINAPERLGIQNDRPEYGGARYGRSRFKRRGATR